MAKSAKMPKSVSKSSMPRRIKEKIANSKAQKKGK